jgi:hypothetical protein
MGHKISRKRRRHIRRKQTLKRGGNPFKYFSNFFSSKPTPKYPTSQTDLEPNPDDNYDDDDVRRSSMVNEEIVRHGPVTDADKKEFNEDLNGPFGGRRMTRRKRRTKRKSRF